MKHLRKIFESFEDDKRYIEDCFLDISEDPNFEVKLLEIDKPEQDSDITTYKLIHMNIYRIHIELGKKLLLPPHLDTQEKDKFDFIYRTGNIETSLEFLKVKSEKLSELYDDIEVAIKRIKDKFDYKCDVRIQANRRDDIDITILVAK